MPEPLQALLLEPYLVCVQHHAHNVALGDEFLDPTHGLKGRFKHAPGLSF